MTQLPVYLVLPGSELDVDAVVHSVAALVRQAPASAGTCGLLVAADQPLSHALPLIRELLLNADLSQPVWLAEAPPRCGGSVSRSTRMHAHRAAHSCPVALQDDREPVATGLPRRVNLGGRSSRRRGAAGCSDPRSAHTSLLLAPRATLLIERPAHAFLWARGLSGSCQRARGTGTPSPHRRGGCRPAHGQPFGWATPLRLRRSWRPCWRCCRVARSAGGASTWAQTAGACWRPLLPAARASNLCRCVTYTYHRRDEQCWRHDDRLSLMKRRFYQAQHPRVSGDDASSTTAAGSRAHTRTRGRRFSAHGAQTSSAS